MDGLAEFKADLERLIVLDKKYGALGEIAWFDNCDEMNRLRDKVCAGIPAELKEVFGLLIAAEMLDVAYTNPGESGSIRFATKEVCFPDTPEHNKTIELMVESVSMMCGNLVGLAEVLEAGLPQEPVKKAVLQEPNPQG